LRIGELTSTHAHSGGRAKENSPTENAAGESATLGLASGCYDVHAVSSMEDFKEAYWMGRTLSGDVAQLSIANNDWVAITE